MFLGSVFAALTCRAASILDSCHDFGIDGNLTFGGTCDGVKSKIDLNRCLVNEIGFLKFRKE